MTDLDKLIEAVGLAALPEPIFHGSSSVRGHWAYNTGLDAGQRRSVFMAYNGSLDAAKALHEALLPPINQYTIDEGPSGCGAQIVIWPNGLSVGCELIFNGYDYTPARAWLIAILKAYKSKVQE